METIEIDNKQYQLDVEKAKEQGLLKEKSNCPMSWKEYFESAKYQHFNEDNHAASYNIDDDYHYDVFNSIDEAKAFCALGKLIQLKDAWVNDWIPDWTNGKECKYTISTHENIIHPVNAYIKNAILVFPTQEMCEEFFNTFKDLIEQAKMFL